MHLDQMIQKIKQAAEQKTGLADYGDADFNSGLIQFVDALINEANFAPEKFDDFIQSTIVRYLSNRLETVQLLKLYPEIKSVKITRPIFIVGLPRTGTTYLHKLVSLDGNNRVLRAWEGFFSSSKLSPDQNKQQRLLQANELLNRLYSEGQELQSKHSVSSDGPVECYQFLATSFQTELFGFAYNVPSYHRWLMSQKRDGAYKFYKWQLQVLQWQNPGVQWWLKHPFHFAHIDQLINCFPDAVFLQIHRDPVHAVSSAASLASTCRHQYSPKVNTQKVGKFVCEFLANQVEHGLSQRKNAHSNQFIDLSYSQLVGDPLGTIKSTYEKLDLLLSDAFLDQLREQLGNQAKDRGQGLHQFDLAEYGLSEEFINRRFSEYIEQYEAYF